VNLFDMSEKYAEVMSLADGSSGLSGCRLRAAMRRPNSLASVRWLAVDNIQISGRLACRRP
jgi:hypothetical protein